MADIQAGHTRKSADRLKVIDGFVWLMKEMQPVAM